MFVTRLECQVSEMVNSDACPRPTTYHQAGRRRAQPPERNVRGVEREDGVGNEGEGRHPERVEQQLHLGSGRSVASEKEVPNMLAILV
jgi:hypothetical protein